MKRVALSLAVAAILVAPTVAAGQGGPGFLFNRPRVSIGIRMGYNVPRTSGTIFEDAFKQFKLNGWDLSSPSLGGELALRLSERWDVATSLAWARSQSPSEYRDWVENGLPIEQETTFQTVAGTIGGRYYFGDRGRSIGRFAWVPARLTPFVGAGVGYTWYTFEQVGDFVDVLDAACPSACPIYSDALQTDGGGATAYGGLGADLSIGKQFYLTGEARYSFGGGGVRDAYSAYDEIDLSGLQVTAGISLRF